MIYSKSSDKSCFLDRVDVKTGLAFGSGAVSIIGAVRVRSGLVPVNFFLAVLL
jgi:hypothetical protein